MNDPKDESKRRKSTALIVGESMISRINELRSSNKGGTVKMWPFTGAYIDGMYDQIKSFLKKAPDNVILHIGTSETSRSPCF